MISGEGDGGTPGLLRASLESLPEAVAVLAAVRDPTGDIVDFRHIYTNPAARAMVRVPSGLEGLVGRSLLELWPSFAGRAELERAGQVVRTGEPWAFEVSEEEARRGRVLDVLVSKVGDGCVVVVRDVTERHRQQQALARAEARYRLLLSSVPDRAVLVYDHELRFQLAAGEALITAGYDPERLVGRTLGQMGPRALTVDLAEHFTDALAGRRRSHRNRDDDGRIWQADFVPLRDDEGQVTAGVLLLENVTERVREQDERDRMLWELQEAQRLARTGSWYWDAATGLVEWSPALLAVIGSEAVGLTLEEALDRLWHPADAPELRAAWERALRDHQPFELEHRMRQADGSMLRVVVRAEVVLGEDGCSVGLRGTTQDVTERRAAEAALRESEERFRLAFDESPIGKALVSVGPDAAARLTRVNAVLATLVGGGDLVGRSLWEVMHAQDAEAARADFAALVTGEVTQVRAERRLRRTDGGTAWSTLTQTVVRDADGTPLYALTQVEDVTARKLAEQELHRQALVDDLTELPNRTRLLQHLAEELNGGDTRRRGPLAVLFLDLDDFKTINDSLGHAAGDDLLVAVAAQLRAALAPGTLTARLGGDEFVVVAQVADRAAAERLADDLRTALSEEFWVLGHWVQVTASVGIALGAPGGRPGELLRDADIAMYRAKAAGKDRWAVADTLGHAGALRRLTLEAELRRALERQELRLHYQPVVDLASGAVVGLEALLRWQHPERGLLAPEAFLDVAETTALIRPIGAWVLTEACAQAAEWHRRYGEPAPPVAVNVSARQLGPSRLQRAVEQALASSGLSPDRLCVELTEREAVAASGVGARDLDRVHELGVRLAVDDFGTGYAGLDYLRRFPFDVLKIDRSFIDGLGADPTDTALTVSLIALGGSLDLTVIAEGVETADQRDRLLDLGCPQGQGRWWSDAVPPAEVDRLLALPASDPR